MKDSKKMKMKWLVYGLVGLGFCFFWSLGILYSGEQDSSNKVDSASLGLSWADRRAFAELLVDSSPFVDQAEPDWGSITVQRIPAGNDGGEDLDRYSLPIRINGKQETTYQFYQLDELKPHSLKESLLYQYGELNKLMPPGILPEIRDKKEMIEQSLRQQSLGRTDSQGRLLEGEHLDWDSLTLKNATAGKDYISLKIVKIKADGKASLEFQARIVDKQANGEAKWPD